MLLEQFEQPDTRLVVVELFLAGLVSQFLQLVDLVMCYSSFALILCTCAVIIQEGILFNAEFGMRNHIQCGKWKVELRMTP